MFGKQASIAPKSRMTSFTAVQHGFKFANDYVNQIGPVTTLGRCGGMAYAALDYYFHNLRIPQITYVPYDQNVLGQYIMMRLLDSLRDMGPGFAAQANPGITAEGQFENGMREDRDLGAFMRFIDGGAPIPLGLINVETSSYQHQVLGIGYNVRYNWNGDKPRVDGLKVFIYDPNFPDQESFLEANRGSGIKRYQQFAGGRAVKEWRAYFAGHLYAAKRPPTTFSVKTSLMAFNNQYLGAEGGGGGALFANRGQVGAWEKFDLNEESLHRFSLKTQQGKFVCAEGGGGGAVVANRPAAGAWESFTLQELNQFVAFKTANGRYLSIDNRNQLVANSTILSPREMFRKTIVG